MGTKMQYPAKQCRFGRKLHLKTKHVNLLGISNANRSKLPKLVKIKKKKRYIYLYIDSNKVAI
jgi:hypothetical protein